MRFLKMKLRTKKGNYLFQKIRTIRKQYFKKSAFFIVTSYPNLIKTQSEIHFRHIQSNNNVRIKPDRTRGET